MTFPMPFFSPVLGGVSAAAIQGVDSASSATDLTLYTFSSLNFGNEASDRYLAAYIAGAQVTNRSISAVNIGGVSATEVVAAGAATMLPSGIYIAAVPTGTTGDVIVQFSGAMVRAGIVLAKITGISSAIATDTATGTSSPLSAGIDISAGGVCFGGAASADSTPDDVTWSNLTEFDQAIAEGFLIVSGACDAFASAQTGRTISATETSGTQVNSRLCLAAWA